MVAAMDGITIEDFRQSPVHTVIYGRASEDTLELLIREDSAEIARVGEGAEVRMGIAEHGRVRVGVVMFRFGGPVYQTLWNLCSAAELIAALKNEVKIIHVSMVGDSAREDLMFRMNNTLGDFFSSMHERYADSADWSEEEFAQAIEALEEQLHPGVTWQLVGPKN